MNIPTTAPLTGPACRAGRALLQWSTQDLAKAAGVSPTTVNAIEGGKPFRPGSARKIVEAFAANSVEITNGAGTGARLVADGGAT
ncbi:helix-turn-helix transcriptional regulator [Brevundimonas sp.]|uniref:helix-turn-helix transcriptional regulator n=1 Tax=Brevundimonas sp. TaxID=1871086 RepID=UPI0039C87C87